MPTESKKRPAWVRWVAEFVLIVGSVYLAVYLEGANQQRADTAAARVHLAQLLEELREDLADVENIISVQGELSTQYTNMDRWLKAPAGFPTDSVSAAMTMLANVNPTVFARRAACNALISGGQLADVESPELVNQLGRLYERAYARVDYNGRFYDEELNELLRDPAIQWSRLESAPLVSDAVAVGRLASKLAHIHGSWNVWYRDLLIDFKVELEAASELVEVFVSGEAG